MDQQGLEARLALASAGQGPEWTPEGVRAFLASRGIRGEVDPRGIEKLFAAGGAAVTVATGIPAEPSSPPRLTMQPAATPPELAAASEQALDRGRPPRVFQRTTETVRVERTVPRKRRLPFLAAQERKEVRLRKREVRRPAEVEPVELGRGYAAEGQLIGTIVPARGGRPGRDVYGRQIPAPSGEDGAGVCLGEELTDLGGEIRARSAGFYRYGKNWVELVPYSRHEFSVGPSSDRRECLLDFKPGTPSAALPPAQEILRGCIEAGFQPDALLDPEGLNRLLEESVREGRALAAVPLGRPQDASIEIRISRDRLRATLTLVKGRGAGRPLLLKEVGEAIRGQRLGGMDATRVREDLLAFHRGDSERLEDYLLAEGRAPEEGQDGSLEWKAEFLPAAKAAALKRQFLEHPQRVGELSSLAEFPLDQIEDIALVEARSAVAVVTKATTGRAGMDVHGAVLPGGKGRDSTPVLYENLQLIRGEVVTLCAGVLEKGSRGEAVLLRARPHQEPEIQVRLSPDRMQATLTLLPPEGSGRELSAQEVQAAIQKAGVVKGIIQERVEHALVAARAGRKVVDLLIAQGQAPRHGRSSEPVFSAKRASGAAVSVDASGRANFKKQDRMTTVKAGELLATVPAPGGAADGWDVTGRLLQGRPGTQPEIQAGRNVQRRQQPDGSIAFHALGTGEMVYDGTLLEVLNVHTVDGDVGLASGNVRFSGSVRVRGTVRSGFSVLCQENIIVEEGVQGALLSAGGSIVVQKGVVGEGRAVLRAKREIRAYFAEQAALLAVGDITLRNSCLRCTLKSNGAIRLESDRGHLVGGRVRARNGLSAANVGSERGAPTEISFGQDYLVADRIELEERAIEELKRQNRELTMAMKRVERAPHPDRAALEKLRGEKLRVMKALEKRTQRVFVLRERFETHFPSEVVVRGTAYPGVVLRSHNREYRLQQPKRKVRFTFNPGSGRIEEKPLSG